MSVLLDAHPLNENETACEVIEETTVRCDWKDVPEVEISVLPQVREKRYYLKLINRELHDPLKVRISGEGCSVMIHSSSDVQELSSQVNITKQIREAYRKKKH